MSTSRYYCLQKVDNEERFARVVYGAHSIKKFGWTTLNEATLFSDYYTANSVAECVSGCRVKGVELRVDVGGTIGSNAENAKVTLGGSGGTGGGNAGGDWVEENDQGGPHVHAHLMAEYAKDAEETDRPWARWQTRPTHGNAAWINLGAHPRWEPSHYYRRRPRPYAIKATQVDPEVIDLAKAVRNNHGTNTNSYRLAVTLLELVDHRRRSR